MTTILNTRKQKSSKRSISHSTKPERNKDIFIRKSDKENDIIILDGRLHNKAIQEITSHTSKFENFNEGLSFKRETSLQRFSCKFERKSF